MRKTVDIRGLVTTDRDGSTHFEVIAAPRAARDEIRGVHDGALKVAITAPPVEGEANAAIVAFLAKKLRVPKRDVEILRGAQSKTKQVRIVGLVSESVLQRLSGD